MSIYPLAVCSFHGGKHHGYDFLINKGHHLLCAGTVNRQGAGWIAAVYNIHSKAIDFDGHRPKFYSDTRQGAARAAYAQVAKDNRHTPYTVQGAL